MNFQIVVANGVKLLNQRRPGWRRLIDPARLNVGSCQDCILAQLYGVYVVGIVALGLGTHSHEYNIEKVESHGFTIFGDYAHDSDLADKFRALTEEWRNQLGGDNAEEAGGLQGAGDSRQRPACDVVV